MFSQRAVIAFLVLCSIIGVVYYIFIYDPLPPNVEIVVSKDEYPDSWQLSPNGDKIVYSSGNETKLLFLDTQQKQLLENCRYFWWVNNTYLRCLGLGNTSIALLNTNDFSKLPIQIIEADNPQVPVVLKNARNIYRYKEGEKDSEFFFVLSENKNKPNENYQINSTNIDVTLKSYTYTTINLLPPFSKLPTRVSSPNQAYYMSWQGGRITIYDSKTRQQIVQYLTDGSQSIYVIGWAWDSSGVYFKGYQLGIMSRPDSNFPILKLVIPKQD